MLYRMASDRERAYEHGTIASFVTFNLVSFEEGNASAVNGMNKSYCQIFV